jgi:glutaredoxin
MVKEFLSREGHPFENKNIEEDDAAYDELMKLGARSVPVTVIAADHAAGQAAEHADHAAGQAAGQAADHAEYADKKIRIVIGYDQARLREALTAAGGGSSPGR